VTEFDRERESENSARVKNIRTRCYYHSKFWSKMALGAIVNELVAIAGNERRVKMFKGVLLILCVMLVSTIVFADDLIRGHWKDADRDGIKETWIDPYYRTTPNSNPIDNYSAKPNINPYTGEKGYKNPYKYFYDYKPKSYKNYKKLW